MRRPATATDLGAPAGGILTSSACPNAPGTTGGLEAPDNADTAESIVGVWAMNRREFSIAKAAALFSAALVWPLAHAQVLKPQAGLDYLVLEKPVPVGTPAGKIEVLEFFRYDCPFCNAFEPILEAWIARLPADVVLRRVPSAFRDNLVPQQRLYYALESMGLLARLHARVFSAIHVDHQMPKAPVGADMVRWLSAQGVDAERFSVAYSSPQVAAKVTRANQLQDLYHVSGVPALGVAGRFYTDGELARTNPRALQVVDYLAAELRAGRT